MPGLCAAGKGGDMGAGPPQDVRGMPNQGRWEEGRCLVVAILALGGFRRNPDSNLWQNLTVYNRKLFVESRLLVDKYWEIPEEEQQIGESQDPRWQMKAGRVAADMKGRKIS